MQRRWLYSLAAAGLFAFTSLGQCKPPDLPKYQQVTVLPQTPEVDPNLIATFGFLSNFPIQILGVSDPVSVIRSGDEETSEPRAPETPRRSPRQEPTCRGCPIQKPTVPQDRSFDPAATRSVLDNLKSLEEAAELIEKARKLVRDGEMGEAKECLEHAHKLVPGAPCEKTIEDLQKEIATEEEQESKKDEPQAKETRTWRNFGTRLIRRIGRYVPHARVKVEFEIIPSEASRESACTEPVKQECGQQACVPPQPCMPAGCQHRFIPVVVRIDQIPLINAMDQIQALTGCPYLIDFQGFEKVGTSPTVAVSVTAEGVPLEIALEAMLRPHRIQAKFVGHILHVTCADLDVPGHPMPVNSVQGTHGAIVVVAKEDPAACEESVCPKCDALHARAVKAAKASSECESKSCGKCKVNGCCDGKAEMVYGLMKACRLAVADGRIEKAAELARQAHALDPEAVESDPMVVKMDLLEQHKPVPRPDRSPTTGGAAEEQEERGADGRSKLVPHFPKVDAKIIEALDLMLRRNR